VLLSQKLKYARFVFKRIRWKKKKRVTVQGEKARRISQIPHTQAEEAEVAPTAKTDRKFIICILFSLRNTKWRRAVKSYYPWPSETLSGGGARIQKSFHILNEFS
jgi:hypothetical protein